eukprot:03659.XXX_83809_83913_1 [CDS] Oithona nana genome sequencing.
MGFRAKGFLEVSADLPLSSLFSLTLGRLSSSILG